jgi:hypothetical protein
MMLRSVLLTIIVLICCSSSHQVEGLVFVTAKVNSIAALNPIKMFSFRQMPFPSSRDTQVVSSALKAHNEKHTRAQRAVQPDAIPKPAFDDQAIQQLRSEIVDLVYERSLERMNSFLVESQQ